MFNILNFNPLKFLVDLRQERHESTLIINDLIKENNKLAKENEVIYKALNLCADKLCATTGELLDGLSGYWINLSKESEEKL